MNILVFGLPGSGKTFFASQLALKINALHISSDAIRNELKQMGKYDEKTKIAIYDAMLETMKKGIKSQINTVLDATFYKGNIRKIFKEKCQELHSPLYFIEISANEALIKERIEKKRPNSEADFDVYLKVKNEFEQLKENHLVLHSDQESIKDMLESALNYIKYTSNGAARD
ncbi:putative kinase [Pedobacter sp. CG_S7]|uniref:AAA family ATPase n=1 Tax=Pedobacter sp. CG_S7 TaxID=3143930 RepID=UPI0033987153